MKKYSSKTKLLACSLLIATMSIFINCKNANTFNEVKIETSPKVIAETYVENLFTWMEIENSENDPYTFIYEVMEVDPSELSDLEKETVKADFKNMYMTQLMEKFESNSELQEDIALENEAFSKAQRSISRSASAKSFNEKYMDSYISLKNKFDSPSRSGGTGENITLVDGSLNDSSVEKFNKYNKKGRILICHGKEGSSWTMGHTSLMLGDFTSQRLTTVKGETTLRMVAISSFPGDDNKARYTWSYKRDKGLDGVQFEPIDYWCGKKGARDVKVYDVYKKANKTAANLASASDANKAVQYANDKYGKPYTWNYARWGEKDREDMFYCSSLVRRAWIYSLGINLCPVGSVLPSDLAGSVYTKQVDNAQWTNY